MDARQTVPDPTVRTPTVSTRLDHWFVQSRRRRELADALWRTFTAEGYVGVDLPLLVPETPPLAATPRVTGGAAGPCRVVDGMGRVLLVRPDITPWIGAQVAGSPPEAPLRLWYCAESVQLDAHGLLEETWRAGAELFGLPAGEIDRETTRMAVLAARAISRQPVRLSLSDARLLPTALDALEVGNLWPKLWSALSVRDFVAARALLLPDGHGSPSEGPSSRQALARGLGRRLRLSDPSGHSESANEWPGQARVVFEELFAFAESLVRDGIDVVLEPGLVLARPYYSGPVFEVTAQGHPMPLATGGRYDALVSGMGVDCTAAGFGLVMPS